LSLVLLPGLLNDARLYAHQCAALADMAAITVADLSQDDSIAGMAARVLASAPARFSLAGLSMGGYVALEILRQAPERVERLALLDTTARPDTPEQTARRQESLAVASRGGFDKIMPVMLPNLVHPDHLKLDSVAGIAKRMALDLGPEVFARQQNANMNRPDARPGLSAVTCPTLVLVGRQDSVTPLDRAEEMAGLIPGARLVVVDECGHFSPLEQPQAVSAVLRYWLQA